MKIERIQQPHQGTQTERTVHKIEARHKNVLGADAVSLDADSKRRQEQSSEENKEKEGESQAGEETIPATISANSDSHSLDVVV